MNYTELAQNRNIEVSRETYSSSLREISKPWCQGIFPVSLTVVIGTMRFLTSVSMQTRFHLKEVRMKFLLLPTVTIRTFVFILASILVRCNEIFRMPMSTHLFCIRKNRRLSSIVLPIVSIHTYITFMIIFSIWTPYCLKVKDIKVHIRFKFFNEFHRQFTLGMGKWAKLSILTFWVPIQVRRTELCFVFVRMVELLYSVVSLITGILIRAFLVVFDIPTLFGLIKTQRSSSVLLIVMIVWTFL